MALRDGRLEGLVAQGGGRGRGWPGEGQGGAPAAVLGLEPVAAPETGRAAPPAGARPPPRAGAGARSARLPAGGPGSVGEHVQDRRVCFEALLADLGERSPPASLRRSGPADAAPRIRVLRPRRRLSASRERSRRPTATPVAVNAAVARRPRQEPRHHTLPERSQGVFADERGDRRDVLRVPPPEGALAGAQALAPGWRRSCAAPRER